MGYWVDWPMEELPPPYEILELADRQSIEFTPLKWVRGIIKIKPRYPGAPPEKVVRAIRIYVPRSEKPVGPDYWDITPATLVYQLWGILSSPPPVPFKIRITAFGVAPKKRFMIEVIRLI